MQWYIYLISASYGEELIWKIGVSKHPEKRFKEHKTANPNLIEINALYIVKSSEIAYFIEARLKKYLEPFKINGEWFEQIALNPELFTIYCDKFNLNALSYIELQKNIKEI